MKKGDRGPKNTRQRNNTCKSPGVEGTFSQGHQSTEGRGRMAKGEALRRQGPGYTSPVDHARDTGLNYKSAGKPRKAFKQGEI